MQVLQFVCCCLRSFRQPLSDEDEIELSRKSGLTNSAVMCKAGLHGSNITLSTDPTNNFVTVTGKGIALGSATLDCDTGFWEIRIGTNPSDVCVGVKKFVAKKPANLDGYLDDTPIVDEDSPSWIFKGNEFKTGDVVGIFWDQTDLPMLSFSLNGNIIPEASILRIRPANDIVPAISLKEGSSCEMIFDGSHFIHPPKSSKFQMIISAKSLL